MNSSKNPVHKRYTSLGRWFPLFLYLVNYGLWFITGVFADAPDLLLLALFPAAAPLFYIVRTRRVPR